MSIRKLKSTGRGNPKDTFREGEPLWIDGDQGDLHFQALIFSEPSDYGIKLGPVSKLHITRKGKTVYEYDRGTGTTAKEADVRALRNYVVKNASALYKKESRKKLRKK